MLDFNYLIIGLSDQLDLRLDYHHLLGFDYLIIGLYYYLIIGLSNHIDLRLDYHPLLGLAVAPLHALADHNQQ